LTLWVLDASVVIKWFLPEDDRQAALELRVSGAGFAAPDLLFAESANILWKHVKRGEIEAERATAIIDEIATAAWVVYSTRNLASDALSLAMSRGISAYDASYVVLAVRLDTIFITADQKLFNKLQGSPFGRHVTLLADYTN
jgi:predicted nucleic acid-binding protein